MAAEEADLRYPFDHQLRSLRKLPRSDARLKVAGLIRDLSDENGWDLNDPSLPQRVAKVVERQTEIITSQEHLIFGKRIEAVFAHTAASLGAARMIVEEDAGELWSNEPVAAPDWRLLLPDRQAILVEVKNAHHKRFRWENRFHTSSAEFQRLTTYAAATGLPLFFAIYWVAAMRWTMVSANHLVQNGKKRTISYGDAQQLDEMALLGDFMIALPAPVYVQFRDPTPHWRFQETYVGGEQVASAAAALIEKLFLCSNVEIEEETVYLEEYRDNVTRFFMRTRVHDESTIVSEPASSVITYDALEIAGPRPRLPKALHAPSSPNNYLELVASAEAEGFQIAKVIFSGEPNEGKA